MNPDQTAPVLLLQEQSDLGSYCLSMRLQIVKWTTKTYILLLCAERVNKCEFSVYTVRIFYEMHARLRGSKSLLTLYQILNKPDFPSLAEEIAEPHPYKY